MDSTTVQSIKELGTSFATTIQELAGAMQVPAEHVYEVLVRQAYAEAWAGVLTGIACLVVVLAAMRARKIASGRLTEIREYNRSLPYHSDRLDPDAMLSACVASIVVGSIGFILFVVDLRFAALRFANPEYYAIKEILTAIGG